jgi:putative transposase
MKAVTDLGPRLGFAAACAAVGLPRATYYRRLKQTPAPAPPRRASRRALSADERRDAPTSRTTTRSPSLSSRR